MKNIFVISLVILSVTFGNAQYIKNNIRFNESPLLDQYLIDITNTESYDLEHKKLIEYRAKFITENAYLNAFEVDKKLLILVENKKGAKSLDFYNQSVQLSKQAFEVGNYTLAGKIFSNNVDVSKSIFGKRSLEHALALSNHGKYIGIIGDLATAEGILIEAYNISNEVDLFSLENANIITDMASIFTENGKYTQAENYFRQARKILGDVKTDKLKVANKLNIEFAKLQIRLQNFRKADELLKEVAKSISDSYPPSHFEFQKIQLVYLDLYKNVGKWDDFKTTYAAIKSIETNLLKTSVYSLKLNELQANFLIYKEKFSEANKLLNTTISDFKIQIGTEHYLLARFYELLSNSSYAEGNYALAIEQQKLALDIRSNIMDYEHPEHLQSLTSLSLIYWANGDIHKAKTYFLKSLYLYKRQYQTQFAFLSEEEKKLFYQGIKEYFDKFNSFVLQNGEKNKSLYAEIFDNQLISKGLLFNSTKQMREKVSKDNDLKDTYNQWLLTRERLQKTRKIDSEEILNMYGVNADSLEKAANYLEKELSLRIQLGESSSDLTDLRKTWLDIKYFLKKGECAFEIIRIPFFNPSNGGLFEDSSTYLGLLITNNTKKYPTPIVLGDGKYLESGGIKYYRSTIQYKLDNAKSYQDFWGAFSKIQKIKNIKTAYISLDGIYNQVSLNTLYNTEDKVYLVDEIDVILLGNLKDIEGAKKKKSSISRDENYFLLGYPNYNHKSINEKGNDAFTNSGIYTNALSSMGSRSSNALIGPNGVGLLPGTRAEVMAIDSLIQDQNHETTIYLDIEATEGIVKNINDMSFSPNIIHIATHGFFTPPKKNKSKEGFLDSGEDMLDLSGLLFTSASYGYNNETVLYELNELSNGRDFQDGILTANEVMNLDLNNTDMVILSACETGLGVISSGEGVYGLQRSIQTAGANSVLMSLWKVSDESTNLFMQYFYQGYLSTHDKKRAFLDAQIKLREKYSSPYFWGAFVLVGY
ncbi:MAG: CHAT domain-containing protein [Cyclobacteriaceae bacterium]|nr:CHAT domain-containing protein [Cyclobacteriaceae bacterium]